MLYWLIFWWFRYSRHMYFHFWEGSSKYRKAVIKYKTRSISPAYTQSSLYRMLPFCYNFTADQYLYFFPPKTFMVNLLYVTWSKKQRKRTERIDWCLFQYKIFLEGMKNINCIEIWKCLSIWLWLDWRTLLMQNGCPRVPPTKPDAGTHGRLSGTHWSSLPEIEKTSYIADI